MDDMKRFTHYDETEDRLTVGVEYDNTDVMEANKADRNDASEFGRYKGNFVRVGRIHLGDIERLKNMGYNLLSPDPDERKRALLYIQENEKHLLTVPGKPIAKKRLIWE